MLFLRIVFILMLFLPPHPNGFGFRLASGSFTKLENLILNHHTRSENVSYDLALQLPFESAPARAAIRDG
jgi:hypothetical protein